MSSGLFGLFRSKKDTAAKTAPVQNDNNPFGAAHKAGEIPDGSSEEGFWPSMDRYIDQLMQDMAPEVSAFQTLRTAKAVLIITDRHDDSRSYDRDTEICQHLSITPSGSVRLTAFNYNAGPGHYIPGRKASVTLKHAPTSEILNLLDAYLYKLSKQPAGSPDGGTAQGNICGFVELRVLYDNDHLFRMKRTPDSPMISDFDLSQFMRERIPIDDLFLFDPEYNNL